jgi:hypothetical protein
MHPHDSSNCQATVCKFQIICDWLDKIPLQCCHCMAIWKTVIKLPVSPYTLAEGCMNLCVHAQVNAYMCVPTHEYAHAL